MTAPQTVADVQHTPGPWAASRQKARRVTANGVVICNAVLRNTGSAKNGRKHGQKAEAEAEANARLIAAAPDFAAAAPDAADMLEQYADFIRREVKADELERHPYLPALEQVIGDLRAALRAAATSARQGETK